MNTLPSLLSVLHVFGVALGVGAATVKVALLLRCKANPEFVPTYLQVAKPITRQIVTGLIVLTLSGVGWLLFGYPITPKMVVKLVMVGAMWVLGPIIDGVVEPRFKALAPAPGEEASPEFGQAQSRYMAMEITATGLFYVIVLFWMLG